MKQNDLALKNILPVLLFLLIFQSHLYAKVKINGIPFIKHYPKSEYRGGTQNWDMAQSSKGLMYFANNEGVLEYDGTSWRIIRMPNNSVVRSLAIDESDRIYVGAFNEFGYLEANRKGELIFHSIVDLLSETEKEFGEVWQIYPYRNGILFHSFEKTFFYRENRLSVISDKYDFHHSFLVNGEFFVKIFNRGLCKLDGKEFQVVNGGELFKDIEIVSILPFSEDEILIATALGGLYLYNGKEITRWDIAVNALFQKEQLYSGLLLTPNQFAFGTVRNGLYILNKGGDIIQHVNTGLGLLNNTVLSLFKDFDDNLWLGLDNGIDYLEISSSISVFPRDENIGAGYASLYYDGRLYLGTNMGLFVSDYDFSSETLELSSKFELVKNTSGQVWSLQVIGDELICGHNKGTFRVEDNVGELISNVEGGWIYLYREEFPNQMIGGTYTGLILFERSAKPNSKWKFKKQIGGFDESSREMIWDDDNRIWMAHGYKGVFRITLNEKLDSCISYKHYGEKDGLPSNLNIGVFKLRDEVVFTSGKGFYEYVPEIDKFEKQKYLNNLFGEENPVNKLFELPNGNAWYFQNKKLGLLKLQVDNSFEKIERIFLSLRGLFIGAFENVSIIDRDNILIGTERGFVHYNPNHKKRHDKPFYTLIREVYTSGNSYNSLLFAGNKIVKDSLKYANPVLKFSNNALYFKFSAPQTSHSKMMSYKYQLQGFDETPSDWVTATNKEYTNLREGDYVFRVLAKNQYGIESIPDEYKFTILPPWYRSGLAYAMYVIISMLLIWLVAFMIRLRMKNIHANLEKMQQEELREKEQKFREEALIAEREIVQLRNEKLRNEVDFKTRELASSTMNIIHKNEVLSYAVGELKKALKKIKDPTALVQVRQLMKTIDAEFNSEQDWEQFELHFDQVHENFLKRLRNAYPQLTPKDLRMCAYLRMNLSTKEIAPLMNISVRGVEISRYRLRKKFNLSREENLIDFLLNL